MNKIPQPNKNKRIETKNKLEAMQFKKNGYTLKEAKKGIYVLEKHLAKWELFEEKVRLFLEYLGFEDISSGQSSWLGRYQIDVVGGYDGTLLIFECKSSGQPKLKKTTQEINIFAGKKKEIEQAIRDKFANKYNEVVYILAFDDIYPSEEDEKTARNSGIYIWGTNYLKTGEDLFSIIGQLAVHYVLKELGVSPKIIKDEMGGSDYKVPSIRITIGKQQIYSFYIEAEKLLNLVYVFRLQPGNEDAYQRFINKNRIFGTKSEQGLTEFVNGGGFFKNTVVCSFEKKVTFESKNLGILLPASNIEFGILGIPKLYGSIWVIDGQHRIYGYGPARPEVRKGPIGVVAYEESEKRQQAKDFIDINQKQKPVDPNTLWDLLSQVDPYSLEGAITKIAKCLNETQVFKKKILIPGKLLHKNKSTYPLKLANICNTLYDRKLMEHNGIYNLYRKTGDVSDANRYPDSVIEYPVRVISEYFMVLFEISDTLPEWKNGFILQNNGFNVFSRVLCEILRHYQGKWDKNEVMKLLEKPLLGYFKDKFQKLREIRTTTSNESGRAREALEIIKFINKDNNKFASEFIRDANEKEKILFEKSEPYQILKELENNLRIYIDASLSAIDINWWKSRVPIDVQDKAIVNMGKNESPWPWVKPENKSPVFYIEFTDYVKIIQKRDNWESVFQKTFKDELSIISKLKELQSIRNKIAHSRDITADDSTTLRLYAQQIINSIKAQGKN